MNIQEIVDQFNTVGLNCYYADDLETIVGTIESAYNQTANAYPKFLIYKALGGHWVANIDFQQIHFFVKVDFNLTIVAEAVINFSEQLIRHTSDDYPLYSAYHELLQNGFIPEVITAEHTQLTLLKKDSHNLNEVYLPLSQYHEYIDPDQAIDLIKQKNWIVRYQQNQVAISINEFKTLKEAIQFIYQQFQTKPHPKIRWMSF